ncbi:MAG: formate/nitrite transporter family protein [Clostridiales Family XIII bacterium]|jgi:formate/nitrite transporter|nr:formate/nitrite transporter family protein [Clostridiales Family XIII bacterium]
MENRVLRPDEILEVSFTAAEGKAKGSFVKLMILGVLAGAFIAFAAQGSNMAAFNLLADPARFGLGRVLAGAVFAVGLMLVVVAGGELFTGNVLMVGALLKKRITCGGMLRNWGIVYVFNFVGSLFIAWAIVSSGLLNSGSDMLGALTIRIAANKAGLGFGAAIILGLLCNWLVCLAVWMAFGTQQMIGKLFAIFFPIWLFVTSGFEHSIANMYYVPAGILAKADPVLLQAALDSGVTQTAIDGLTWGGFLLHNLLPVTLGNIIGGAVFVALAYLAAFHKKSSKI